jgi:multifunctional beta-oxidation protein
VVTIVTESREAATGQLFFTGSTTLFIREAGGFGGRTRAAGELLPCGPPLVLISIQTPAPQRLSTRSPSVHPIKSTSSRLTNGKLRCTGQPLRQHSSCKAKSSAQRLSGDMNPLHIDPKRARYGSIQLKRSTDRSPAAWEASTRRFCTVGVYGLHFQRAEHMTGLCSMGIATKAIVDKYGPIKDIKVRFAGHVFPGETLEVSSWREGSKIVFCQSTPLFKVRTAHPQL